jgi:nucleoside-diphosphate-sugar epimerase
MRGLVLVAAAGFVGGWVAAHIHDRGLGAGVDVPTEFRYRPQPEPESPFLVAVRGAVDGDAIAARLAEAMSRHPAGKRRAQ